MGKKASLIVDLLSDKKWHDLNEIDEIYSLTKDEQEEVCKLFEEIGIITVKREGGETSRIRGTKNLKKFTNLPVEK